MCGIVGILRNESIDILQGSVRKMTANVSHRGPDDLRLLKEGSNPLRDRLGIKPLYLWRRHGLADAFGLASEARQASDG